MTESQDQIPGPGAYQAASCFGQYMDLPYYLSVRPEDEGKLDDAPAGILTTEKIPRERTRSPVKRPKSREKVRP